MDLVRQQLARIAQQLGGLSVSQRLLAGALIVIVIMTLLYWGRFAGQREMTALLATPLAAEETTRVTQALQARGIPFEVIGGRINVPVDRSMEAWAEIGATGVMPSNSQQSFDQLVGILERVSPFDSNVKVQEQFKIAKQRYIASVLVRLPNVKAADVGLDSNQRFMVGRPVEPTASVILSTGGMRDSRKLAESAADIVTGFVAGLPRKNVRVIIDGVSVTLPERDADGIAGGDILAQRLDHERHVTEKILERYSYIPGLEVMVKVDLNTRTTVEQRKTVDPTQTVQLARTETSENEENREPDVGGEAGAAANIGLTNTTAPQQTPGSTRATSETTNEVDYGKANITIRQPAGDATVSGVSVGVPRSYFVALWRARNPDKADPPTDSDLQPIIAAELDAMRSGIMTVADVTDDSKIDVREYADAGAFVADPRATAGAGGGMMVMVTSYAREVAVGVLALASLFMVSRMVKKSAPSAPPQSITLAEDTKRRQPPLVGAEDVAAEVAEGGPVMMGQELDPQVVEGQQMMEQVSAMVKSNPEAAAQLIKTWLRAS